jgi:tRNA(fMet)-specific endonuclease VapC
VIPYLLDTNACIELIRKRSQRVLSHLRKHPVGSVGISSITLSELYYGVARSADPERNLIALTQFCAPIELLPFDGRAAAAYGPVRADLERSGFPAGPLDTLIAAHALSLNAILVTDNEREFRRVKGLQVENWARR